MEFASFDVSTPDLLIAIAVHNGHELRPGLARMVTLDEPTRLREEDPYTGSIAQRFDNNVVVYRSRFEVDLNRERGEAIYQTPDDAWGLQVWQEPLDEEEIAASLHLYDRFYADLGGSLDRLVGPKADSSSTTSTPTTTAGLAPGATLTPSTGARSSTSVPARCPPVGRW
jgi:N-formylglutamate amidohydrolase